MLHRICIALPMVCFGFAAAPALAGASMNPTEAPNGSYQLEQAHSQILFSIFHIGLTPYYGRFDRVSGTLDWNGNQPEQSHVSITIGMDSIDTPSAQLNDELKSKTVFDAAQFPEAKFESTKIVRQGPDRGKITGNLTVHNVTKPVTLDAVFRGTEHNPLDDSLVLGFSATTTIKRSDFGLTGMVWEAMVGDPVELTIEAMFQKPSE